MKEVLFVNFGTELCKGVLENVYNELQLKHCYVIDYFPTSYSDNIILKRAFDHYYITRGVYPDEIHKFPPLDASLVEEMAFVETITLKMMDRLYNESHSYQERKQMYLNHLRFWNHFLINQKIDTIIMPNYPHEMYDYIICQLCKKYKILFLNFATLPIISNRVILMENYPEKNWGLINQYNEIKKNWKKYQANLKFSENFQVYWNSVIEQNVKPPPFYNKKKSIDFIKIAKMISLMILKCIYLNKLFERIKSRVLNWRFKLKCLKSNNLLKKTYLDFCEVPNLNKPFIYIPLHYQPEMTTSPLGGIFTNQELMIYMIAEAVPNDTDIIIKEHPTQWLFLSRGRTLTFYNNLKKVKNIKFAHPDFSSFKLTSNAIAVATITGSVGWEALAMEVPVLIFGDAHYRYLDCVHNIDSQNACNNAIKKIFEGQKPTIEQLKQYLLALDNISISATIDKWFLGRVKFDLEKNTARLSAAIIEKLR